MHNENLSITYLKGLNYYLSYFLIDLFIAIELYEDMHSWTIDLKDEKGTTSFGLETLKRKKFTF